MRILPIHGSRWTGWIRATGLVAIWATCADVAHAQLQFTEVMHSPIGDDNLWEWVEVRNTSATAIDVDGWIFDDDDDVPVSVAAVSNIKAANGNTVIAAGGVAVLYAGSNLGFDPTRFTNAWGAGITLIPVNSLTSLTDADAIGLWPDRASYDADDFGAGNPRRSFAHASASLNYASGFPTAAAGHSIVWNGTGSPTNGANWVESQAGALQANTSVQTVLQSTPINGADRGNPGVVPGGAPLAGLRITEVMYDPASAPDSDWEWVEVYNNTGSAIDFSATKYVLHDDDGADFTEPNITSGSLPQGGVGVLFNAAANTLANMQAAWGSDINFIPVATWGNGFANGGDAIAIWSSIEDYHLDASDTGRSTDHAVAVATYDDTDPWPANNNAASIFVGGLNLDPAAGANWIRSGAEADTLGSSTANPILGTLVDHPGGDVGSPGYAPGASAPNVLGDYNGNQVVDAADYTVWRDHLSSGQSLLNDASPGSVTIDDYNYWKAHFGATAGVGSVAVVAEPATILPLLLAGLASLAQIGGVRRRWRPALR